MPMYEYQCEDCGRKFEVRQKFSDKPVSECVTCGGQARKMISRTGFSLKGEGWYQQGYAPKPASCEAASSSNESCAGCPKAANG